MEIVIIGVGAIGGLFAALLAPLASVRLYTTNAEHGRVLTQNGLTLITADGAERRTPVALLPTLQDQGGKADLVLLCTKSHATSAAAAAAVQCLTDNGLVLTLQNGLGNLERIAAVVGRQRVTAGTTAQAATLEAPGRVRHAGCGETVLGIAPGQESAVTAVADLFNRAGIPTRTATDIEALLWSKLLVNVGINALAALLRVPNGVLAEEPACAELMAEAVAEATAVARALGVRLPDPEPLTRVRQVCALTAANRASMLQDILRGAPTEIEAINGAVVALGRDVGVPTPVNRLLTGLIRALEVTTSRRIASPSLPTSAKEPLCPEKN